MLGLPDSATDATPENGHHFFIMDYEMLFEKYHRLSYMSFEFKDTALITFWLELENTPKGDWKQAYQTIRKIYLRLEDKLKENNRIYFKAYGTPIWNWMNEVERLFYHQYRCIGGIPLYPLMFVNGYFLDFANPKLKIGIEIDGKKFHNTEKDTKRDSDLADFGWKILRITAADVTKEQVFLCDIESNKCDLEDYEYEGRIREFFNKYSIGLIQALRVLYFDKYDKGDLYYREAEESLYRRTLVWPEEEEHGAI